MGRTASVYYVRFDTYWQGSPDRFAGPFASIEAAEMEVARAIGNASGNAWSARALCDGDVKTAIRVFPDVLTKTEASRSGMRPLGNPRGGNIVGARIPANTDELFDLECALRQFEA